MIVVENKKISKIKLGDQTIGKVYVGDSLVFPSTPPFPRDVMVTIQAVNIMSGEQIDSPKYILLQVGDKVGDMFNVDEFVSHIEETPPIVGRGKYFLMGWNPSSPIDYVLTEQDAESGGKIFTAMFTVDYIG